MEVWAFDTGAASTGIRSINADFLLVSVVEIKYIAPIMYKIPRIAYVVSTDSNCVSLCSIIFNEIEPGGQVWALALVATLLTSSLTFLY